MSTEKASTPEECLAGLRKYYAYWRPVSDRVMEAPGIQGRLKEFETVLEMNPDTRRNEALAEGLPPIIAGLERLIAEANGRKGRIIVEQDRIKNRGKLLS